MNENINLCEILKDHVGETFWCPLVGNVTYKGSDGELVFFQYGYSIIDIPYDGKDMNNNIAIFPSKDQRDWNKWIEEQKIKVPKTWSELKNAKGLCPQILGCKSDSCSTYDGTEKDTPIEKSALALLKIHQLIEVGYGGNVLCNKEKHWEGGIIGYTISIKPSSKSYLDGYEIIPIERKNNVVSPIMFKTKEYAEKFIKYEENCSLLRIFNMVAYPRDINQ